MNKVQYLLNNNFSSLTIEEKCSIKELGRPKPVLNLSQKQKVKGREYCRAFNDKLYERNSWICGCDCLNKFFCFPCLLFAKGKDNSWTKTGVADLAHLSQKIKKHEQSISHGNACLDISILGRTEIRQQLSEAFRENIEKQNGQVRKNRYVLSKIIDCIRFCGEFELALRGHDEKSDSENPGIFKGLVNFSASLDNILKEHLQTATVFKGTSKEIQNDLLECMLYVCQQNILQEILSADYVSIIADETTDVSTKAQMVVVFRYVLKGIPVERFWTFLNPTNANAETLSAFIKTVLIDVIGDNKEKLISQSYDGTNTMSGQHSGVQTRVKAEYTNAHFVHCYAHQLNLIMSQAANQNREVRIFFANLQEVNNFFSHSSQRTDALEEIVKKRLPSGSSTRWNYNSRSVLTVYENLEGLILCLEKIEETSAQATTINQAQGLRLKLLQPQFVFWLTFFAKVMPHVQILYDSFQKRNMNPVWAKQAIFLFKGEIEKIRNSVDEIQVEHAAETTPKRARLNENPRMTRNVAAKEVCDAIVIQAKERFEFTGHLVAANLFDNANIATFNNKFPDKLLETTVQSFPFLEKGKLKTELQIIYGREDFKSVKKVTHLLGFLLENNLSDCVCETVKLLKVLITIPMTTAEAERCFSCLKRVKTFLRSTMDEDRLSALAMMSLEKEMTRRIADFNEQVIERFATKKERRMDFFYKNVTTAGVGV